MEPRNETQQEWANRMIIKRITGIPAPSPKQVAAFREEEEEEEGEEEERLRPTTAAQRGHAPCHQGLLVTTDLGQLLPAGCTTAGRRSNRQERLIN